MANVKILSTIGALRLDGSGSGGNTDAIVVTAYTSKKITLKGDGKVFEYTGMFEYAGSPKGTPLSELGSAGISGLVTASKLSVNGKAYLGTDGYSIDVADMFSGSSDVITQILEGNDSIKGGNLADIIYGYTGDDKLDGGQGDDQIFGGDGNDTILAGTGNDLLNTGQGIDVVTTGTGYDQITIAWGNEKTTVTDFNAKQDKIDLGDFGVTSGSIYAHKESLISIAQVGKNVVITGIQDQFQIILTGVSVKAIDYTDFV